MKTITALALSIISSTTFANVTGNWTGWAYWTFDGQGPKCDANVSFRENQTEIRRVKGLIDCSVVVSEMPELILTKKDGKIFLDGKAVGSYSDSTYSWQEMYDEATSINVEIQNNGTNMDYSEKWLDVGRNREIYDIKARFFKSGSLNQ